jgi:predicted site-specific integrase-resolvase
VTRIVVEHRDRFCRFARSTSKLLLPRRAAS